MQDNIPHTYKSDTETPERSTRARTQTWKKNLKKFDHTIDVSVVRCRVFLQTFTNVSEKLVTV